MATVMRRIGVVGSLAGLAGLALVWAALVPQQIAAAETRTVALDASSIAKRPTPLLTGMAVHFGIGGEYGYDPLRSAALLGELRAKSYRDDLPWDMFDWPSASHYQARKDRVFAMLQASRVTPVLIINSPNPTVTDGNPPLTAVGRAAFSNFAMRAVHETKRFRPIYEIWNEWNMNAGEKPNEHRPWLLGPGDPGDPRAAVHYIALAKAAVPAVKRIAPEATVLVGAVGMDDGWPWTDAIIQGGALEGADGLSVHLYNHCERKLSDRTATQMVDRLEDLQAILRRRLGREFPVYVTEFGWPTVPVQCVITQETAAANIAQFFLWSSTIPWIKGSWLYQLKNKGRNPNEMEDNFGLYDYDYNAKPIACPVKDALQILAEMPNAKSERPFRDVFMVYGETEGGTRLIAWTSRPEIQASLSISDNPPLSSRPLCGTAGPAGGSVKLGPMPTVIELGKQFRGNANVELK